MSPKDTSAGLVSHRLISLAKFSLVVGLLSWHTVYSTRTPSLLSQARNHNAYIRVFLGGKQFSAVHEIRSPYEDLLCARLYYFYPGCVYV